MCWGLPLWQPLRSAGVYERGRDDNMWIVFHYGILKKKREQDYFLKLSISVGFYPLELNWHQNRYSRITIITFGGKKWVRKSFIFQRLAGLWGSISVSSVTFIKKIYKNLVRESISHPFWQYSWPEVVGWDLDRIFPPDFKASCFSDMVRIAYKKWCWLPLK